MPRIQAAIPLSAGEIIRNRIAEILADELAHQDTLNAVATDDKVTVWMERFVPASDVVEYPMVNVSFNGGQYANQHQGSSAADYTYHIDCYTYAVGTNADADADSTAQVKLHRMLAVCRAILEDTQYKTLGFAPGLISYRQIMQVQIGKPDRMDTTNATFGRLTLMVKTIETVALLPGVALGGIDTHVTLEETALGFRFIYNTPTV